jgi:hypothetical protein
MVALLLPLVGLSGRVFAVFWYVPMLGLAVVVAALADRLPRWTVVPFLVLWLPLNYSMVRGKARELLALDDERRSYIDGLRSYARSVPRLRAVVYQNVPEHMYPWGVEDGIRKVFGWQVDVVSASDPKANDAMSEFPMAVISYDRARHTIQGTLRAP